MANLITEKQKKEIKTDYYIRLFSVSLLIPISLLGIFLLAYVIPYYLSLDKKDAWVAERFTAVINAENKENTGESVTKIVNRTIDEMKAVEFYGVDKPIPSGYFSKVIDSKNAGISITKLSFMPVKKDQIQLFVSGLAKNREGLVTFIEDLKIKGGFASVESPVSDLAKNNDIFFTLNIKTTI